MIKILILILACFLIQIGVDWALQINLLGRREWTALLDPVGHGALCLMVIVPWAMRWKMPFSQVFVAWLSAILIDLDHFIAAGSFSIQDAISLSARPMAHSLLFAFGAAVLGGLVFRSRCAAGLVTIALISHISRDASGGGTTPLFWPSDLIWKIPYSGHLIFWLVFSLVGFSRLRVT